MLPRKHRLTRKEITKIKESRSHILQGRFFGLVFQPYPNEQKFGLIISNKISKKAVERNRVKRLLMAVVKEEFGGKEGKFLFLAKKSSLAGTREDFIKEMEEFERKIK